MPTFPSLSLRVDLADGVRLGPGKVDLLEGIAQTGSIAAAGRRMGMSYKRAWTLVETLNEGFATPLVETAKGGKAGGGAALTALGEKTLASYRRMEADIAAAAARELKALSRTVRSA